jgi:hypothetical protein
MNPSIVKLLHQHLSAFLSAHQTLIEEFKDAEGVRQRVETQLDAKKTERDAADEKITTLRSRDDKAFPISPPCPMQSGAMHSASSRRH